jgi:hypothetical protein
VQRPVETRPVYQPRSTQITNNYYVTPRNIQQRPQPYYQSNYYQPSYYRQQQSNGVLVGLGLPVGLLIGGIIGRRIAGSNYDQRPYPGSYQGSYPGATNAGPETDNSGILTPKQFESFISAASNAPNDAFYRDGRITASGYKKPTTPEERLQFKQIMYGILKITGRQIDDGAMLSEKGIAAGDYKDPRKTALPTDHFSDNFGSERLAALVQQNADLLRSEYANAYQQIRNEQRQAKGYYQTASGPTTQRPSVGFI